MDEEHTEDGFLRKRSDRFPRAERANLQSHFQEKTVTGLFPVVQEDALVFRVPAREREHGIVVSLAREPLGNARVPDPLPYLLRPEPAEEKVFRVDARKLEKKLPFGGRDFRPLPLAPQERKRQEPAQGRIPKRSFSAHGMRSVSRGGKSGLTRAEQKEYFIFFPGNVQVARKECPKQDETHLPASQQAAPSDTRIPPPHVDPGGQTDHFPATREGAEAALRLDRRQELTFPVREGPDAGERFSTVKGGDVAHGP